MDDIERMINLVADITAKCLGKQLPSQEFVVFDEIVDSADLYEAMFRLLQNGQIGKAEDLLFETTEKNFTENHYLAGMEFYAELEKCDDDFLKEHDFSREEIEAGRRDLKALREKRSGESSAAR